MPPASIDSFSSCRIRAICSGVASWPTESSFITIRRRAQWPTRNPTLTAVPVSLRRSRYSPKVCQFHGTPSSSASSAMPSTRTIIRLR